MDSSPEKSVMTRGGEEEGEQLLHATERREEEVWRDASPPLLHLWAQTLRPR